MYFTALPIFLAVTCADAQETVAVRTLARLNSFRKMAGVKPVVLDPQLSSGCLAHARYLARYVDPLTGKQVNPHDEDAKLPGYTKEGLTAARMSVILFFAGRVNPTVTIDQHMASFFHRISLIQPGLKRIGFGHAYFKGKRCWVVIDSTSGREAGLGNAQHPVLYPADEQKQVPAAFTERETPNPIPPEGRKQRPGYPITATFPARVKVTQATATLQDGRGQKVPAWFSAPEKPANIPELQYNTIGLIPAQRLRAKTTYTVTMKATVNGKPWSKTWTFTTG